MAAKKLSGWKALDMREADFYKLVNTYIKYPAEMREAFFSYWSEPDRAVNQKMRFEKEKTWDTGRRLGTWDRNNFGNKAKSDEPGKVVHMMQPKQEPARTELTDIQRLDQLLSAYEKAPTKYTIEILSTLWPLESLTNCYNAIKENKLWDPRITKADLQEIKDERRLKATVIIRTLDYVGCKGWTFANTLQVRNKLQ